MNYNKMIKPKTPYQRIKKITKLFFVCLFCMIAIKVLSFRAFLYRGRINALRDENKKLKAKLRIVENSPD